MTDQVIPNCRYGHGDLMLVASHKIPEKWGYISHANAFTIFSGDLYVCRKCGYTELFDDSIDVTVQRQEGVE